MKLAEDLSGWSHAHGRGDTETTACGLRVKERWWWRQILWAAVQPCMERLRAVKAMVLPADGSWISLPGVAEQRADEVPASCEQPRRPQLVTDEQGLRSPYSKSSLPDPPKLRDCGVAGGPRAVETVPASKAEPAETHEAHAGAKPSLTGHEHHGDGREQQRREEDAQVERSQSQTRSWFAEWTPIKRRARWRWGPRPLRPAPSARRWLWSVRLSASFVARPALAMVSVVHHAPLCTHRC